MIYLIALILIIIGGIIVSYIAAAVDVAKSEFPLPFKIGLLVYMIGVVVVMVIFG